jgi:hypothetical protein
MIRSCPAGAVPTGGGLAGAGWTISAATERGRALVQPARGAAVLSSPGLPRSGQCRRAG